MKKEPTRYYLHGDRIEDGRIFCASCDCSYKDEDHFYGVKKRCSDPKLIKFKIQSTKRELRVLKKHGYYRPKDAENVLF